MWVIVGLGNPGAAYANSRHNVGFMAVGALAARWRIDLRAQGAVHLGRGTVAGQSVVLLEPQTYMNRSADALAELEPMPADLMVVHDDLDLPVGQLRLRPRGGSGGHRGVASIIERVGAEFVRVRIGIGHPPAAIDVADYVLSAPAREEQSILRDAIERACQAIASVLTDGIEAAMSLFNARPEAAPN